MHFYKQNSISNSDKNSQSIRNRIEFPETDKTKL